MAKAPAIPVVLNDNEFVVKCRTRLDEKSTEKVLSTLTIVFDDIPATREFAKRGVVIAWQSLQRAAGVLPETDRVLVSELIKRSAGGGFKVTPDSLAARVTKMSDDDYKATLTKLGMSTADVARLMKARATK